MNSTSISSIVDAYLGVFAGTWADTANPDHVRFVVLDSETTGTDPARDHLVSIGAVAVKKSQIVLADSFEATLKIAHNLSSVMVHGITRDEARDGMEEPEAVLAFVEYLRDGVIVGHHIGFDVKILSRACEQHFGFQLQNRMLDTMDLTLHFQDSGAFAGNDSIHDFSLDSLCSIFGVEPRDRHTAGGDAFITAQIFLRLLRLARKHGRDTLRELCQPYSTTVA